MKKKQLKEHKFSTGAKIGLTIIQLICAGIVVYHTLFTTGFYFTTIHALCAILTFLTLLNQDYLTKLLNHKIWKYPGKLAYISQLLVFYINHLILPIYHV